MRLTRSALALMISAAGTFLISANASHPLRAQSNDPTDVATIRQLEQDMGNAMIAGDVNKLSEIYADDFATVGPSGKVVTKQTLLTDFKSFHDKLE